MTAAMQDRMGVDVEQYTVAGQRPDAGPSQALVDCAHETIANGTTLYGASIAGGSTHYGVGTDERSVHVAAWLDELQALRDTLPTQSPFNEEVDRSSASSVTGASQELKSKDGSILEPTSTEDSSVIEADDAASDSEEEMDVELVKAAIRSANIAFERANYSYARALHREVLALLKGLSTKQRSRCDMAQLQYEMAVCAYYLETFSVALPGLLSVLHLPATTPTQRKNVFSASYLLARGYVEDGKLELARQSCESALAGRRKALGKADKSCLECVALLARICELQGQDLRAKLYEDRIPLDQRAAIMLAARMLAPRSTPVEGLTDSPTERGQSTSQMTPSISGYQPLGAATRKRWIAEIGSASPHGPL